MAIGHKRAEFDSFETIPDAVIAVDRDGSIVFANRHAYRIFDYESGRLVGLTIDSLIPERYRDRHARLVRGFQDKPSARPMGTNRELHGLRSDGEEFPAEIAIGPTEDGIHTVAVIRDITAFVKMRVKLSESEARSLELDLSFRNTPIGLCHFDRELRYVRVNQWLATINGLPVQEHLGRTIAEVLPNVAFGVESQLRQVLQTGEPIINGLVETTTPAHPATLRTYMHNFFPNRSANGALIGIFGVVQDVTDAKQKLEGALSEIKNLRDRLRSENLYFQEEIKSGHNFQNIIGNSAAIMSTTYKMEQVAATDATVLLFGETGTGKELFARAIHALSKRKMRPLIKVDCTTLPPGLIESELFGHEKGAFTGAHESKPGRFELADGGTIFLDEIGELPTDLQAKLLLVIEEREFRRLGGRRPRRVDIRVIAATNRDLPTEMRAGRFRSDLYYRLNVFPIEIPPLRDRREDIPLLVSYFVSRRSRALGKDITSIPKVTMDGLMAHDWPGNVRELENACERAIIQSPGRRLVLPDNLRYAPTSRRAEQGAATRDLKGIERRHICEVLEESNWKIKGEGNAASRLGMNPSTLRSRIKKLGIERPA